MEKFGLLLGTYTQTLVGLVALVITFFFSVQKETQNFARDLCITVQPTPSLFKKRRRKKQKKKQLLNKEIYRG